MSELIDEVIDKYLSIEDMISALDESIVDESINNEQAQTWRPEIQNSVKLYDDELLAVEELPGFLLRCREAGFQEEEVVNRLFTALTTERKRNLLLKALARNLYHRWQLAEEESYMEHEGKHESKSLEDGSAVPY